MEILRGAALVELGAVDDAADLIRQGLAKTRNKGATYYLPFGLMFLAETLARRGEHGAALAVAQEGLEVADATGQRLWDAELHRLRGVACLADNKIDEGQVHFDRALRVARQQQAKSYELRAAMNVARWWGENGRRTEAHELLAPIYSWFTEGFDIADMKEAETLLAHLV